MSTLMKELGIDRMPPEERIALALDIWESLGDARPPARLTSAQGAELLSRDAELEANAGIEQTWQEIRARVENNR